ncbi:TOBE domain-containing protein [Pseudoduganella sp. RAF19]|uniref:TOBE domain-containing protein n=3 Tax=unclassified Pseudoduganella TaxID=2637179 RepID=UPI003F97763D
MSNDTPFALRGSVWMMVGDENFGGHGRIALLASIAECGSITQAAKAIGMSYKAAWDAIDTMNTLAGEPLVARAAGGKGGGGTRLTARGLQLVENFRLIEREHRRFIDQLSQQAPALADDCLLIGRLSMKTSARNQFAGKVARVKQGAVNDEVELEIPGGERIVAIVTHDSTESLGLKVGAEAFALVKASSIILVSEDSDARFSARNRLKGEITRITTGAVNSEVIIGLNGGGAIAAIITNESCSSMGLAPGGTATAIFKASSVIVGVPA